MVICSGFYNSDGDNLGYVGSIADVSAIVFAEKENLSLLTAGFQVAQDELLQQLTIMEDEMSSKQKELSILLGLLKDAEKEMDTILEDIGIIQPYLNREGKMMLPDIIRKYKHKVNDDSWLNLQAKFDETNYSFFKALESAYPNITKTEKTLCAYLKMNLSLSEIAKVTHRSLNSISVALMRLRLKLGLNNNEELRDYISKIRSGPNPATPRP